MATQPSNKKKSTGESRNVPKFRFINHSLTKADVEQLESLDLDVELPYERAFDAVLEGLRFSLSFDPKNHCFVASFTDKLENSPFENSCLSGRGSTPLDAWYSLAYRHYILAQEDWTFFGDDQSTESNRFG